MTTSIRIRGIYATALSALLSKRGYAVVESSPVISERLGLPTDGQAQVRLRDRPDRQGIWLEGSRARAAEVAGDLAALLPDAVARSRAGLGAGWEVEFPAGSKWALDAARAEVWPTLPGHHQLKIVASGEVDRAEEALASGKGDPAALAAELRQRLLLAPLHEGLDLAVEHVKPSGREIKLPGRVASQRDGRLLLWRGFRAGGSYDSLDRPKLSGDYGEVELLERSWVARRRYLRADGALIGELYNIQTPTELYPDRVRYLDLQVDVAAWPDGRVLTVDLRELAEDMNSGLISPRLGQRALVVAEGVRAALAAGRPVRLEDWCDTP